MMKKNSKVCAVVALMLLAQACRADAAQKVPGERWSSDRSTYTLALQGCPIEFVSRPAGLIALQSSRKDAGYYSRENFRTKFDLSISFNCTEQPAPKRCPEELAIKEDEPSTLRLMQVVKYANINPRYEGGAVATTFTAVNPPRSRELIFCFGDERRTLFGRSIVGNERRAYTREVLQILRSIRFTD